MYRISIDRQTDRGFTTIIKKEFYTTDDAEDFLIKRYGADVSNKEYLYSEREGNAVVIRPFYINGKCYRDWIIIEKNVSPHPTH